MGEAGERVHRLLTRAAAAGAAPALVARWGRVDGIPRDAAVGRALVTPHAEPAQSATRFDLASLTKPLSTATLTLLAIRSGELELESRAESRLPALRGSAAGRATVHQLLTHTSGLPAWLPLYALTGGDPRRLLPRLALVGLESRPGDAVVYSCPGYIVLGRMLEAVADASLRELFRRLVASPLGVEQQIGFGPGRGSTTAGGALRAIVEERETAAAGGDPALVPPPARSAPDDGNARFLGGAAGNSGLFGTAAAVFRLAAEYLGDGTGLLAKDEIALAVADHTPGLQQHRGLGWQLASSPGCSAGAALDPRSFGHTGYTGTSVWVDPVARTVNVLLTNRNHPWQREHDLHPLRRRFHALAAATA